MKESAALKYWKAPANNVLKPTVRRRSPAA
jgi:hypothetical protein